MLARVLAKNKGGLSEHIIEKTRSLLKNEVTAYKGSFLVSLRERLLPYHQRGMISTLDPDEEERIVKEVYDEVNDLFINEHWLILKGDLLEQTFNMINPIRNICLRHCLKKKLAYGKNKPELLDFLRSEIGHSFEVKQSNIDHHEAGDGVFIKTKNKQSILPGTLLGFFPGVICDPHIPFPERANEIGVRNFLNRFDNFWIDSDRKLPFPTKMGMSMFEHVSAFNEYKDMFGVGNMDFEEIDHDFLNPYAIGHKLNHPPPDVSENVCFVDFDIPYTWFPYEYFRHLPYIDIGGDTPFNQTFRKDILRTIAVVAARFIEDGEELYVNYFEDDRVPIGFTTDWLLRPPPLSPYLVKKKMITEIPFAARFLYMIKAAKMEDVFDTWEGRSYRELSPGESKGRKRLVSESIKTKLAAISEKKNQEIGSENQKKISDSNQESKENKSE